MRRVCLGKQDDACPAAYHGTASAMENAGCCCPHAKEAHRIYEKRRRQGRNQPACIDPTGTIRRMRALAAIGWPLIEQARRFGWNSAPSRLVRGKTQVTRELAARVAALYEELKDVPGPSAKVRDHAARKGWPTPAEWDMGGGDIDDPAADARPAPSDVPDPVVVDRALEGATVSLTPSERHHAVHVGLRKGMSLNVVARRLHMSRAKAQELAEAPLPDGYELVA